VLANAFGKMIGLGATFAVIAYFFVRLENQNGAGAALFSFLVAVASG